MDSSFERFSAVSSVVTARTIVMSFGLSQKCLGRP